MGGQVYHFQPDLLNLLVNTIPKLCKRKKDVIIFFSSAGVNQKLLADLNEKVQKDASSINKYEIARTALVRLNDAGDAALRERREIVKRVVEFNDFSGCWPDDQIPAMGLVAKVRELVNVKDSFTRLQQNYESRLEEDKKKRQLEEEARLEQLKQKREKRQNIKSELSALYQETDTKKRGKQLEGVLNRFFESEGILVRESFTIKGENNEGVIQQIDGAIEVNSHLYLIEMKWWKEALGPGEVAQHVMRLFERSDVRGIFISASGYTDATIINIQKALNQKIIVLFTLKELVLLLESENSFESLLKTKVEAIQLEGKLVYDL
ncbi:restriction endonuclease [Nostoc sp. CENA67]|uniref:Restriction endonuclease n=1 Tax=Amazonocrinis nigriterrae CENA67 TaxID=2794033 RepID=A0A8J7L9P3_9NOST|nr:restriction endonuclease [Amazonocrinis nigriterrae]MBH8564668.1 restriction endonuclease [Amazonocrinis nigriterrae CENA67]